MSSLASRFFDSFWFLPTVIATVNTIFNVAFRPELRDWTLPVLWVVSLASSAVVLYSLDKLHALWKR